MNANIIDVKNLTKRYINFVALNNISFDIGRGELVGLIGSNGAGKSTLLHILMGFISFNEGNVSILGQPLEDLDYRTKENIGFVPEEPSLLPWATTIDTAALYKSLYPEWDEETFQRLIVQWEIVEDKRTRNMSKGQKRLAEIALCLSCQPELLILDEPFVGLDAVMRFDVLDEMKRLNAERETTIFYSTHILSDIEKIAKRLIIIREGEICLDKQISELDSTVEQTFIEHYGLYEEETIKPGEE
ncbi:ABC transporter ATP-binding protein [bacterium]|nr:ABC transporter ATP-binding protein [bacterium]